MKEKAGAETSANRKRRIWCLPCPFTKTGFPVLGSFGKTQRSVVIFTTEEWQRLCADVPALQTMEFEVGTYE